MDEGLSDAVTEVFVRLFEKGLVYRASYIINWCPRCETALSDEESEHADTDGKLYYIRYPLDAGGDSAKDYITVATTRPETLLGDVAVAISPGDARYGHLAGRGILLPVLGRRLAVIEDAFVDPEFGTGIVKVTPAHDPNDFEMGQRHGLAPVNVMNGDGTMNDEAGPYAGLDRFTCRERILADLEKAGLLEKVEDHKHAVGHCYRCDTVVEPRLSPQWFVRMAPLAAPAVEAVTSGKVRFVPERWTKVYLEWMENIRDWCISRQIWWGHRIPVFYCDACDHVWAQQGAPDACTACGSARIRQDEDVLDTWFSSWLWPFSTFGWPARNDDLAAYYPGHDLVTASEIIFFWVARMIMAGLEFMGDVPFTRVYIHGTVRDDHGLKMSKSLGNAIDPITIIEQYSADALRFSLIMITATGQDVYVSSEKFEIGRNFGTKLWNAARFVQMQAGDALPETDAGALDPALLSADDRHILARLDEAVRGCTANLEKCRFNDAALALYEFIWHRYCDWYLEYAKDILYGDAGPRRDQVLKVMHVALSHALRLLHPLMPFVTEELWHAMGYGGDEDSIMLAPWPEPFDEDTTGRLGIDAATVDYVEQKHELIRVGRTLRSDYGIVPGRKIRYVVKPHSEAAAELLRADRQSIQSLLKADPLDIDMAAAPQKAMPSGVSKLGTLYMPLAGLVDVEAEVERLSRQLEKVAGDMQRATAKLENANFVSKAPPEVVEKQRARKQELLENSEKLKRLVDTLSQM